MGDIQSKTKMIPQCWQAVEASAWTAYKRRRILSMPIGLVCKSKYNEINITFGLLAGVHGGVSLIYAAGIRTWWKGRWWWKGWNWTWTPIISDCHIRICDQWGWILVNIPIWMFVPKAMCMTNKLLTDKKRNVQTCDDDDSCDGWVICQHIFSDTCIFCSA